MSNDTEEIRQRKETKTTTKEAVITVKTCSDPVAIQTYEDMKKLICDKFPERQFKFVHELYPIPRWRDIVSRLCNVIFILCSIILMAVLIVPKTPYAYLLPTDFLALFRQYKWYVAGVVIFLNYGSENLSKTGAFEIYYNDELVSSKLADGDYPDEGTLFSFIEKKN